MRIALIVGAVITLTVAGFVVSRHQIAAAQGEQRAVQVAIQAAPPTERSADTAPAAAGLNQPLPPPELRPAPTPAVRAVETAPPLLGITTESQPQPPANYGTPSNTFVPTPYGGWQRDFAFPIAASAADPETQALTAQDQQLEAEVQALARQLADSGDEKERADLKEKLAAALEKQFDAQQKLRELEISRIEARVQKLRDLVRKRTDARRKIIDNRYEQLLNDAEGLGWNSTAPGAVQFRPNPAGLPGRMPVLRHDTRPPAAAPLASPRRQ